jgi:hypothetical protein
MERLPSARLGLVGCASLLSATELERPQPPPSWGPFLFGGRYPVLAELGHSPYQNSWLLKLNLMVSADCEPTSASRIWRSSESSTMDCDHSKLKATVFGIHDWLNYLQDQAAKYRKLVEQADDPFVKTELLALASVCEEIADNIEDHLTGGEDHAPRGPLSRLS